MRVLVIGSLPPPVTDRAKGLLAEVVRRRREGATVEVLSPTDYSVAHRYLDMPGPLAAVEIARAARGADEVIVQLQPGFPFEESAGRAGRALGLGALATSLRSVKGDVVLRLHSIHDLPRGAGGRAAEALWTTAARIEVGDGETRSLLEALVPEPLRSRISLAGPPLEIGSDRARLADAGGDADLETVTAVVRARAAHERATVLADPADLAGQVRVRPRVPLWEWAHGSENAAPAGSVARRTARATLYAFERRPLTRPLARGARIARRLATKR